MAPLLALIGFMGSGKTTTGERVAQLLGWNFRDLDAEVEKACGKSISDMFSTEGEHCFRNREAEVLEALMTGDQLGDACAQGLVLSLGGGSIENSRVRDLLRSKDKVVYLEISAGEAWERVNGSGRPLARDRSLFDKRLEERRPTYEGLADRIVSVAGKSPSSVAEEVAAIALGQDQEVAEP